ncbi:TIGR03936 family radical SAM-associated protein [[Ruminococcus] torques]|uniref:TIGR03936 family radical SAM-associated protein n=1 Tax=[Ruminococcus] torques TaxID=33039 RepID=UPI0025A42499|nr:TIGR03936 family radical SAM-associated protein [[Ruminococcus] torques]MDM8235687.1 TIGR03936 family radical SAM-associated protein [[Ruminococcus] torques]
MKARIKFRKYGALRFIGHLDVMRFFQKLMRRADIPIAFTGGYSPHMIMSFASPLGIGLTSDGEYLDIELTAPVDSREAVKRMNKECVEGIEIISIRQISDEKKMTGMTILAAADYLISVKKGALPENWKEAFADFMAQREICVIKQTKRSEREEDIRPLIFRWEIQGENIWLQLAAGSRNNLKPDLVMDTFLSVYAIPEDSVSFAYHRLEMYADKGKDGERNLVSLESLGQEISM